MRLFRVIMQSGVNMDITAHSMRDDPESEVIYFYHDEAQNVFAACVQRSEVAGMIFHRRNSSAIRHH